MSYFHRCKESSRFVISNHSSLTLHGEAKHHLVFSALVVFQSVFPCSHWFRRFIFRKNIKIVHRRQSIISRVFFIPPNEMSPKQCDQHLPACKKCASKILSDPTRLARSAFILLQNSLFVPSPQKSISTGIPQSLSQHFAWETGREIHSTSTTAHVKCSSHSPYELLFLRFCF